MPKKLLLAATVAGLAIVAGAAAVTVPRALAQGAPEAVVAQSVDDDGVAEQSKKKSRKKKKKANLGAPPRGSRAGSNSGE